MILYMIHGHHIYLSYCYFPPQGKNLDRGGFHMGSIFFHLVTNSSNVKYPSSGCIFGNTQGTICLTGLCFFTPRAPSSFAYLFFFLRIFRSSEFARCDKRYGACHSSKRTIFFCFRVFARESGVFPSRPFRVGDQPSCNKLVIAASALIPPAAA